MKTLRNITTVILGTSLMTACYDEITIGAGEGLEDWTVATHSGSATPNYDEVFAQTEVKRLDVVISEDNWDAMLEDATTIYGEFGGGNTVFKTATPGPPTGGGGDAGGQSFSEETPMYVPCSVFLNGIEWYYVGIRFKGNSSMTTGWQNGNRKLPFRLEFDYFEDAYPEIEDQTFHGFNQLALGSNFDDAAVIREKVATDLYRDFGIQAPQTSFIELYIDYGDGPIYFGVYTIVEVIFDTMLEAQFGSESGNCYKPEGTAAQFGEGDFNESEFEKKNNDDAADWSDVQATFTALHATTRTTDAASWRSGLEAVFDADRFMKWLAANTTMQNWDVYGLMNHNYYLYNDPATGQLTWIPWDNNEALMDGKMGGISLDMNEVTSDWPLITYLYADPVYKASYDAYVESFVSDVFNSARMSSIYQSHQSLIQTYVDNEQTGYTWTSSSEFSSAIDELISHVSDREAAVSSYLSDQWQQ